MALGRRLSPLTLVPDRTSAVVGMDSASQDGAGPGVARPHRAALRRRAEQYRGRSQSAGHAGYGGSGDSVSLCSAHRGVAR